MITIDEYFTELIKIAENRATLVCYFMKIKFLFRYIISFNESFNTMTVKYFIFCLKIVSKIILIVWYLKYQFVLKIILITKIKFSVLDQNCSKTIL